MKCFLFGTHACNQYNETDSIWPIITGWDFDESEFDTFRFTENSSPEQLLNAFHGWGDYIEITPEERQALEYVPEERNQSRLQYTSQHGTFEIRPTVVLDGQVNWLDFGDDRTQHYSLYSQSEGQPFSHVKDFERIEGAICHVFKEDISLTDMINGFHSWRETHHLVCEAITLANLYSDSEVVRKRKENGGQKELWELSHELTNKFEKKYSGQDWEEIDFYFTVGNFLEEELKTPEDRIFQERK